MRLFLSLFVLLFATLAFSFQTSPRFNTRSIRPSIVKLASTPKYDIVPVDKPNIQSAAAVTGGILGFVLGGPVWAVVLAAVSNYVVKKEDESGEALQGFGKTVVESYNFLNKINAKYEITTKLSDFISSFTKKTDSELIDKVKTTYNEAVAKVEEINKEYDLIPKTTQALAAAAELSDAAIDKVVELNHKYDFVATVKKAIDVLIEKIRENTGAKTPSAV